MPNPSQNYFEYMKEVLSEYEDGTTLRVETTIDIKYVKQGDKWTAVLPELSEFPVYTTGEMAKLYPIEL